MRHHLACLLALPATLASQTLIRDIDPRPGFSSGPDWVVTSGNRVFFSANDNVSGRELWTSDGKPGGTFMVADVNPGPGSSSPSELVAVQGGVAFRAPSFAANGTLYVSERSGTFRLTDPEIFAIGQYAAGGDRSTLYFVASTNQGSAGELYTWRGGASVQRVTDFHNLVPRQQILVLLAVEGQRAWFTALGANSETLLYVYEPLSLRQVTFPAGTTMRQIGRNEVAEANGKLYFPGHTPQTGIEPWVADPATASARMLGDMEPGVGGSDPRAFVGLGADVVFAATTAATGTDLFKYQPNAPAPVLVADLGPGPAGGVVAPWPLVVSGNHVFFVGYVPATGQELWRSDGSAAGTSLVRDVDPGTGWGYRGGRVTPVCASGSVLFGGTEPVHGTEMWTTDGTQAGTRMLFDLVLGPGTGIGGGVVDGWAALLDTTWFFLGTTPATGTEPFAFEAASVRSPCTTCPVAGCAGTNGVPSLTSVGQPTLGNGAFAVRVSSARASTVALFLLDGPGSPTALVGGCTLFTGALPMILVQTTDGVGEATVNLPIPNSPWLAGALLRAQWAVLDPNGAFLQSVSFSNGCHIVVGN